MASQEDYLASQATKSFMKKVGAIPDKKWPSSGSLTLDEEGNVSWFMKGVKKTLQKSKVPFGVGLTERQVALKKELKDAK